MRKDAARGAAADDIDPQEARRRLDVARTALTLEQKAKAALEVGKLRGELAPTYQVKIVWALLVGNFRTRVLEIPSKVAGKLVGITNPAVISTRRSTTRSARRSRNSLPKGTTALLKAGREECEALEAEDRAR